MQQGWSEEVPKSQSAKENSNSFLSCFCCFRRRHRNDGDELAAVVTHINFAAGTAKTVGTMLLRIINFLLMLTIRACDDVVDVHFVVKDCCKINGFSKPAASR